MLDSSHAGRITTHFGRHGPGGPRAAPGAGARVAAVPVARPVEPGRKRADAADAPHGRLPIRGRIRHGTLQSHGGPPGGRLDAARSQLDDVRAALHRVGGQRQHAESSAGGAARRHRRQRGSEPSGIRLPVGSDTHSSAGGHDRGLRRQAPPDAVEHRHADVRRHRLARGPRRVARVDRRTPRRLSDRSRAQHRDPRPWTRSRRSLPARRQPLVGAERR